MNRRKYKDKEYSVREIKNLRELLDSSAVLYQDRTSFMERYEEGKEFEKISYWQLKQDVNALGTALISMGLKDRKIAVIGDNSYYYVVTYFAVANGTGVIVPIDKELPENEVLNLIERAGVSCVVFDDKLSPMMKNFQEKVNTLEHFISMGRKNGDFGRHISEIIDMGKVMLSSGDSSFIKAEIDEEKMCSLLFTSGTTGMAKGVMLSHKNIAANVYNLSKYVNIKYPGTGLSVLPMHHSYEMTCHIMAGLYQGITIAICEGLRHIASNLVEVKATVMLGVPLVFEATHKKVMKQAQASGKGVTIRRAIELSKRLKLYNRGDTAKKLFTDVHKATGGHIGLFISGGAAINPEVIKDFEAMGFPMIQGYGMTENAPIIAVNKDMYSKAESVGFPLPGTEVMISDPDEQGTGEIICKGPSVMLGYYENREETQRVLKEGWLYTGDYGYFDDDGMLYISGRKKSVIVTKNGKNIFPEEVEFYLTESEYILEALVFGEDDIDGDVVIKAILFPNFELLMEEKGEQSDEEIKKLLKEEIDRINDFMPLYKRVRRFGIRRLEFEKTTTRKVKRFSPLNYEYDF